MFLQTIADQYLWVICVILLVNIFQRKIPNSDKKRFATIYLAALALLFDVVIIVVITRGWPQWTAAIGLLMVVALGIALRKWVWPFRLHCPDCGKRLDLNHVMGHDDNRCDDCWAKAHPEEAAKLAQEAKEKEEAAHPQSPAIAQAEAETVDQIDWDEWEPTETCVITYLFDDAGNVLLIDKKRGLGNGLVNAPGGHIEEAETAMEAAIREFKEETGLDVSGLKHMGVLNFQFRDGLAMKGHVFFSNSHSGTMVETDEAKPYWCPTTAIPYDKMWADDQLWLPLALDGKHFEANFIFDDRTMLSSDVQVVDQEDSDQ